MTTIVKKQFEKGMRAALIAALMLAGAWSAGCTDDLAPGDEAADVEPAPEAAAGSAPASAPAVVHSFTQPSGDIIDCVPRDEQPSMLTGSTGGRAIAAPPPFSPAGAGAPAADSGMEAFLVPGRKDARGVEPSCPEDAVPVRRSTADEGLLRARPDDGRGGQAQRLGSSALHQHAIVRQSGSPHHGAHARINVWTAAVESAGEFSDSRITVARGGDALFAGVHTYPGLYGSSLPRLYLYSSLGGSGCFNTGCGRFVQVDRSVVIGGALAPVSTAGGSQHEVEASFFYWQGNWWLGVNGRWVGYYPGTLFAATGLAPGADYLAFGGEILDDRAAHPGRHTMTDMGSGAFPPAWYGHAAYQRELWYYDTTDAAYDLTALGTSLSPYATDALCYDVSFHESADPTWRSYLFLGGPGYSASCQ